MYYSQAKSLYSRKINPYTITKADSLHNHKTVVHLISQWEVKLNHKKESRKGWKTVKSEEGTDDTVGRWKA